MTNIAQPPPAVPALPEGKSCSDCVHFKRCRWLISCDPAGTSCDWTPSRFRETKA